MGLEAFASKAEDYKPNMFRYLLSHGPACASLSNVAKGGSWKNIGVPASAADATENSPFTGTGSSETGAGKQIGAGGNSAVSSDASARAQGKGAADWHNSYTITVVVDDKRSKSYTLEGKATLVLGKNKNVKISVEDKNLGDRHCTFELFGGMVRVKPQSNSIRIMTSNGEIHNSMDLGSGERITLSKRTVVVIEAGQGGRQ
jgi:hypothetical protein